MVHVILIRAKMMETVKYEELCPTPASVARAGLDETVIKVHAHQLTIIDYY